MQTKICSICKLEKSITDFHKCKGHSLGVDSRCKLCKKELVLLNKDKWDLYHKEYRTKNKDKIKEYCNSEHGRSKRKQYGNTYYHEVRKFDLKFKLNDRMSGSIRCVLKRTKSGKRWESLVGYKYKDLFARLESTLPEGKTWNDFLDGNYHIDHIVPLTYFDFDTPYCIDFLLAWRLENLRIMDGIENIKKSDDLDLPEQQYLLKEITFFRRFQDMYRG